MPARYRFVLLALARLMGLCVLPALATWIAPGALHADPIGPHFYVAPIGGFSVFDGRERIGNYTLGDNFYAGGRLGYQWRKWLGLEVAGGYSPSSQEPTGPDVTFLHGSANLVFSPYPGRVGKPFILLGGGGSQLKPQGGESIKQMNAEAGGGLVFWMSDALGVRLEARDLMWLPKNELTKIRTHTIVFGAGVSFAIGATPRDTDGDGVPDTRDKCPDTPLGATVDAQGCPHDSDGDGVLDGLDKCPDTPKGATVDAQGCPHDADGDGVFDGLDKCANTPKGATVDAEGCPHDADRDSVPDGIDKCPDTPPGAIVDAQGCPKDSDGDGVPDGIDQCPDTPHGTRVDARGCNAEAAERDSELVTTRSMILEDPFLLGRAELVPTGQAQLDVIGQTLVKYAGLRVEIGVHTDSHGPAAAKQKLSESQAKAVRDYLVQKFPALKPSQFVIKGYGKSKPLLPDTSPENMAKNRRVEFKVLNPEVLKAKPVEGGGTK